MNSRPHDKAFLRNRPTDIENSENVNKTLELVRDQIVHERIHYKDVYLRGDELRLTPHYGLLLNPDEAYAFNEQSRRHIFELTNIPKTYYRRLLTENPELLANNVHHGLRSLNKKLLLRLTTKASGRYEGGEIRAILPGTYNRFDNLYIVQSLLRVEDRLGGYKIKNILYDGEYLLVEYLLPGARKLLQDVNDEVMIGFRIANSETSFRQKFTVELYFERLVCTNGMTTKSSENFAIPKKIKQRLSSHFPEGLPPNKLPVELEEEIDNFLLYTIGKIKNTGDNEYKRLRKEMADLHEQPVPIEGKLDALAHISGMMRLSSMTVHSGISRDEIFLAYREECENSPHTEGTALVFYNAFTRYVSNFLSAEQPLHDQHRRPSAGRPIEFDRSARIRLSESLFNCSHRLFTSSLDWKRVIQTAKTRSMEVEPPPLPEI